MTSEEMSRVYYFSDVTFLSLVPVGVGINIIVGITFTFVRKMEHIIHRGRYNCKFGYFWNFECKCTNF